MPGVLIAAARHNRPTIVVYGGSILSGKRHLDCPALGAKVGDPLNIGNFYESYGSHISGGATKEEHADVVEHACPGSGGCGGMFTANTVSRERYGCLCSPSLILSSLTYLDVLNSRGHGHVPAILVVDSRCLS